MSVTITNREFVQKSSLWLLAPNHVDSLQRPFMQQTLTLFPAAVVLDWRSIPNWPSQCTWPWQETLASYNAQWERTSSSLHSSSVTRSGTYGCEWSWCLLKIAETTYFPPCLHKALSTAVTKEYFLFSSTFLLHSKKANIQSLSSSLQAPPPACTWHCRCFSPFHLSQPLAEASIYSRWDQWSSLCQAKIYVIYLISTNVIAISPPNNQPSSRTSSLLLVPLTDKKSEVTTHNKERAASSALKSNLLVRYIPPE